MTNNFRLIFFNNGYFFIPLISEIALNIKFILIFSGPVIITVLFSKFLSKALKEILAASRT